MADAEQTAAGNAGRRRTRAAQASGQVRDADFTHAVRGRGRPGLRAGRTRRRRADGADRLAGGVPLHPRAVSERLPRPAVDDPAVRRVRQRPADQRALPDDLGRRRRRAERRLRHADADGPRLRRPAQSGRGRALRGGDRLGGRHGGAVRRHRPRRGHHLDDDLRARRCRSSACTSWRPSGRASIRRRLNGTLQTDIFKEYIAQKEWLFAPEPHLRLIGDLMEYCTAQHPGVQAAQRLRLPHPRGRLDGRAGAGVHPGRRVRLRRARPVPRAGRRPVRARAELLLRRPHRLLRGDRQVPGGPADLGALAARPVRRDHGQGAVAALPHPDRRGVADRAAAVQQRGPDRGRGAGGRARRHQLAAHQRAGRDPGAADRGVGRDRAAHPAGAGRGDRRGQRGRPARRLLVRRGADRPDRGGGRGDLRPDRAAGRRRRPYAPDRADDLRAAARASRRAGSPGRSPTPRSATRPSWRRATRRSSG